MTEKYTLEDGRFRLSNEMIQKIRAMEEQGYGVNETCRRLDIQRSTVLKYRLNHTRKVKPPLPEEEQARIRQLRLEGLTTAQIVEKTGYSKPTVIKYGGKMRSTDWNAVAAEVARYEDLGIFNRRAQAVLLGIPYTTLLSHIGPSKWRTVTVKDIHSIRERYRNRESVKNLAAEYGCSETTIREVLNYAGAYKNV